ncbi:MAG: DUF4279 domain-containing protein [Rhizobiales bacterium]|nr:DUF4279 domain-containing protein [Hyphomicrobiales bacterium]
MNYDDAYPTCRETFATFRVITCAHDRARIDASMAGITATKVVERTSTGHLAWLCRTRGQVDSRDVRRHVDWLLDLVEPRSAALANLAGEGAEIDIFCYWLSASGHGGPTLSPAQLRRLAALGIEIAFDVYFDDEPSEPVHLAAEASNDEERERP